MSVIDDIADKIKNKLNGFEIDMAIVLGSGWNNCTSSFQIIEEINYSDIEGMPKCTVKGHQGKFIFAKYKDKNIGIMQGRIHMYEGYTAFETTIGLQVLNQLGAKICILTNASGGINYDYQVNDIIIINDIINMTGRNSLIGLKPKNENSTFVSMGNCINHDLKMIAENVIFNNGLEVKKGVFAQVLGPSFETNAEIRMLKNCGADCVAMSTGQEVIMARYLGMKVLVLSYISNMAQGISEVAISHDEVCENAKKVEKVSSKILAEIVELIKI